MPDLYAFEHRKRVGPVVEALADVVGLEGRTRKEVAELVSRVSSLISSIHQPDPSEVGLFNAPPKPRRRNYQLLEGEYTCVFWS